MPRGRLTGSISWKHGVGEVLLIVVGVLIALTASDWQGRRADRQTELAILREITASLSSDLQLLESGLERLERINDRGAVLRSYLSSGAPYADSLDTYFGTIFSIQALNLNPAAYESLKSQGLGLVSSESLRLHIARVYEQTYPRAERSVEAERQAVLDVVRPFLLLLFEDVSFGRSATPLNYDALVANVPFLNTLDYRLQIVRQSHIPALERSISEIGELLDAIIAEVGVDGAAAA